MSEHPVTTGADITALVAMLRHIQCEPASFDTYSMASAAERAADAIEHLSLSATASEKDAARYRRLRQQDGLATQLTYLCGYWGPALDEAIDAAMEKANG